jgi:hypothetical protein
MTDGLLFVYTDPGPLPMDEFHDWYDTEHGPARLTVPGIANGYRFAALDDLAPQWLATYDLSLAALDSAEYKAVVAGASDRERSIMSRLATLDRRVYELIGDSEPAAAAPPPAVLAVSLSVPPGQEDDLAAWYTEEHIPMLLEVPGWRRIRRFRLVDGAAPQFLSLHEIDGVRVFDEPGYREATSTPWRDRIVASAIGRERRVFGLRNSFG